VSSSPPLTPPTALPLPWPPAVCYDWRVAGGAPPPPPLPPPIPSLPPTIRQRPSTWRRHKGAHAAVAPPVLRRCPRVRSPLVTCTPAQRQRASAPRAALPRRRRVRRSPCRRHARSRGSHPSSGEAVRRVARRRVGAVPAPSVAARRSGGGDARQLPRAAAGAGRTGVTPPTWQPSVRAAGDRGRRRSRRQRRQRRRPSRRESGRGAGGVRRRGPVPTLPVLIEPIGTTATSTRAVFSRFLPTHDCHCKVKRLFGPHRGGGFAIGL